MSLKKGRSRAKQGPAFIFVDAEDRVNIRQQAARSGRRKERENQKDPDPLREPQVLNPVQEVAASRDSAAKGRRPVVSNSNPVPFLSLSYNGYETLRVKYNFDVTDLASFTDVDLGGTACLSLQDQPTRLASLLRKGPSSFMSYLPSSYGSSACLDYAISCVAARAGQMLGFPIQASAPSVLHLKALASLQTALNDRDRCLGPDVYGATRLLAIYELFAPQDTNNWIHHNRGGIKLVEHRGPETHKFGFDRALLKSQGPSIIVDEMYKKQTSIFEGSGWQHVFQQASETETDVDSSLWWQFFRMISFVPGILKDIGLLFRERSPRHQYLTWSSEILDRAKRICQALHDGHIVYQHKHPHPRSLFDLPVSAESPDRIRLREFFLYVTMYLCRVRATLSPTEMERATAEVVAQSFAVQALLIEKMTAELDPVLSWHLEQRNALSQSIIETRDEWLSDETHRISWEELRVFLAQRWLKWENSWRDGVLTKALRESKDRG